jgi:hypothetical protein
VGLIQALRRNASSLEDKDLQMALVTAAQIAVQGQDTTLADAVANVCLEKAKAIGDARAAVETMFRLVECSATDPDRAGARSTLIRRLENLVLLLERSVLPDVLDGIEVLQSFDADLAMGLGRARAWARLGVAPLTA